MTIPSVRYCCCSPDSGFPPEGPPIRCPAGWQEAAWRAVSCAGLVPVGFDTGDFVAVGLLLACCVPVGLLMVGFLTGGLFAVGLFTCGGGLTGSPILGMCSGELGMFSGSRLPGSPMLGIFSGETGGPKLTVLGFGNWGRSFNLVQFGCVAGGFMRADVADGGPPEPPRGEGICTAPSPSCPGPSPKVPCGEPSEPGSSSVLGFNEPSESVGCSEKNGSGSVGSLGESPAGGPRSIVRPGPSETGSSP